MTSLMNPVAAVLYGWSVWSGVVVAGAILCVAALVALVVGAVRPAWFSAAGAGTAGSPGFGLASGTLTGLPLGMGIGLLGGFAFEYLQSLHGPIRFTFVSGVSTGLTLGFACGALGGFALGRISRQSSAPALGAFGGLIVGLAAFRVAFGPSAGFGPETDSGVGPEIGVLLATTGALLGALTASLLRARIANSQAEPDGDPQTHAGRGAAIGAGAGAFCGLIGAAALWLTAPFPFILPGVAPGYSPSGAAFAGGLYGVALLVMLGGLSGGLAGALGAMGRWRGVSLAITLALGLLFGLTLGLTHGDVGGPMIVGRGVTYDPTGSVYGLAGGTLLGALTGIGCAMALRWAEGQRDRRTLLVAVALLALGGALLLEPAWFHPLFGVDIR